MTTQRPVKAKPPPPSVSDRLMEAVAELCPLAMARYLKTGQWGEMGLEIDGPDGPGGEPIILTDVLHPSIKSPYTFKHTPTGRLVQIASEDGDVIGGVGATTALAVTHLRMKIGLEAKEESDA